MHILSPGGHIFSGHSITEFSNTHLNSSSSCKTVTEVNKFQIYTLQTTSCLADNPRARKSSRKIIGVAIMLIGNRAYFQWSKNAFVFFLKIIESCWQKTIILKFLLNKSTKTHLIKNLFYKAMKYCLHCTWSYSF